MPETKEEPTLVEQAATAVVASEIIENKKATRKERKAELRRAEAEARKVEAEARKAKADAKKTQAEARIAEAEVKRAEAEVKKAEIDERNKSFADTAPETKEEPTVLEKAAPALVGAEIIENVRATRKERKAELRRAEAEARRVEAEARKAKAEIKITQADAKRTQAEATKADAEARRAESEVKRAEAEFKKAEAEVKRAEIVEKNRPMEAATARDEASVVNNAAPISEAAEAPEAARPTIKELKVDLKRAEAEARRVEAEAKKAKAEIKITKAEATKAKAEATKADAEARRAEAEVKRAEIAEKNRAASDAEANKRAELAEKKAKAEDEREKDERLDRYLSEIGTLSALVASHDAKIRRIEQDQERMEREADEQKAERARRSYGSDASEDASGFVDAEQIVVRENKQPVYDEEAIKRDIESMNRRALPGYLAKSDKKLRMLEKRARRAERRIDRSTEDDRIEATLIAISVRKEIVDILCENLKCCTLFRVKKHNDYFTKRIRRATARYNALVAIYESLFNEELTKADPSVVNDILDGEDYMPLPSVTYVKETVKVPVEDTELSSDGETVKVARRITASETKLRRRLDYHREKKNSATALSQRASHLAECLMVERDIVELFSQGLLSSVIADNKKEIKLRKRKLDLAVAEYNAFADELENAVGDEIVRAKESLSDDIIASKEYTPLPEIKYALEKNEPDKNRRQAEKERRATMSAVRRGEIMPDDIRFLNAYISRSDKAALKLERLAKRNDRSKRRLRGEALNRAILNSAILRARIVLFDRDSLIAAYRLDARRYISACKERLLVAVQNYNAEITEYDDATGIKLVKISPTLGEDIVNGRSYQTIPELLWRERFIELADLSSLTNGDGQVFVFPTLDKVARAQSTDEGRFVIEARLGEIPLSTDRPIALPVNTARLFKGLEVDSARKLSQFNARLKRAERLIERELLLTERRMASAESDVAVRLIVKRIVLLREIVSRRIEALTYAVEFSRRRRAERYKLGIIETMVRYNSVIDEYNAVSDEKFSYADAHIPYAILAGRDYSPLPEIVYRREFVEKNGDEIRVVSTLAKNAEQSEKDATASAFMAPTLATATAAPGISDTDEISPEALEAWNSAARSQYNGELAESAALEAKNHSEMAGYMKRLSESYSISAKNNNESARYYRDLAKDSADRSDHSVKMAGYYARLAEEQRSKAAYIASQAAAYERDAMESAQRVRAYAEKTREAVDIANITMLDARDSLERKIGVGIVTSAPGSYRASVVQILDDQGLRKYAEKNDRNERIKQSRMRGLIKRASDAVGNEKITLTLDALIECKGRIDIIVDILRQAVRSDSQRYKRLYSERLQDAISDYNAIAKAYTSISLKPITPADPAIVNAVLEGKRFNPLPDITYTRGFRAPGEENVVVLKPGVTVEEAVSTTTFADRVALSETISKQLGLDIDSVAKGVEYEIKMLERSENVSQAYRFGIDGKKSLKRAKKKIKELRKQGLQAVELERHDNERYYSVVYANPMTVSISRSATRGMNRPGASRLEMEHNGKTIMAVREDIARIRENVIALLDERHKLNCEIVALYTGSDVDPHGLPVSEKYQEKRMDAARRSYRRLKGRAEVVRHLSNVSEVTKAHIFSLMNKKIVAESNLELFKYRYKNECHSRAAKKLILKDIKATMKTVRILNYDINGFFGRAVRVHKERKNEVYRGAIMFVLFMLLMGTAVLGYIFREPIAAFIKAWLESRSGGGL